MKVKAWNEKCARTIDAVLASNDMRFYARKDCAIVCPTGDHYFIISAESRMLSAGKDKRETAKLNEYYECILHSDAKLSDKIISGHFNGCRNKIAKLSAPGVPDVFVQEKFMRAFPKNALYYIEKPASVITVGIWEKGQLHIIGGIMPILPMYREFISND